MAFWWAGLCKGVHLEVSVVSESLYAAFLLMGGVSILNNHVVFETIYLKGEITKHKRKALLILFSFSDAFYKKKAFFVICNG